MTVSRRNFLLASAGALAVTARSSSRAADHAKNSICAFTKPFNSLSFDELAERMAEIGFDGIEAPIRKGGHVEPPAVPDQLPALAEALAKRDLEITVMTSDINDPSDPLTESVLKTAAKLGVKRYRMKYFKYDLNQPLEAQWKEWKPRLVDLAAMNHEFGITGVYQNHAGRDYMGASIWDMAEVLKDIDPDHIGVAYDIRHAAVEGGTTWPVGFHRILPHIRTVYFKDFVWGEKKPENVPLGEGRVDGPAFVKLLRKAGYSGPISLHEEYLDHKKPELVPDHLAALKKDLSVLRSWLGD